jgi:hypothetical protein
MRRVFSNRRGQYLIRLSIFLLIAILVTGMAGCDVQPVQYELSISSTEGGNVTCPGEGTFICDEGTLVNLTAQANESYIFDEWRGDVSQIADVNDATTTIIMNNDHDITANFIRQYTLTISSSQGGNVLTPGEGIFIYNAGTVVDLVAEADDGYQFVSWTAATFIPPIADARAATTTLVMDLDYSITANFAVPTLVRNWHDLNATGNNPRGIYILMNGLNSSSPGYEELAGPAANEGKGWQPIGDFAGTFDGGGHNISDLFINRPDESGAALFRSVPQGGGVINLGVVNATVTGDYSVAALAGYVGDTVTNCYSVSSVNGTAPVGGLIASNYGTVTHCHSISSVNSWGSITGPAGVGGLIGENHGTVNNCYSVSAVNGGRAVGSLVGWNYDTVSNCSAAGSASSSDDYAGGLVGWNYGTVSGCHATGTATGRNAGGLVGSNFGAHVYGGGVVTNSYSTGSVTGAGCAGGLIGSAHYSSVTSCYSTGTVTGEVFAGGLIGQHWYSSVTFCYSTGTVTGDNYVGGLVGGSYEFGTGTVSDSFWDTETSGQVTSDGGMGKTTAQMQDVATFSDAGWNIIEVALNETNPTYIWNILNYETYPFLSWQL